MYYFLRQSFKNFTLITHVLQVWEETSEFSSGSAESELDFVEHLAQAVTSKVAVLAVTSVHHIDYFYVIDFITRFFFLWFVLVACWYLIKLQLTTLRVTQTLLLFLCIAIL